MPTLAPVSLALYGTAGVMRRGRLRDYVIAGAGIGLAAATKYTGGITILCLLTAFVTDASGGASLRARRGGCAMALAIALVAFLIANPYAILDFSAFSAGVHSQASLAAGEDPVKLGHPPRQRDRLLPVDVHVGAGLGPDAGRDRRRGRC